MIWQMPEFNSLGIFPINCKSDKFFMLYLTFGTNIILTSFEHFLKFVVEKPKNKYNIKNIPRSQLIDKIHYQTKSGIYQNTETYARKGKTKRKLQTREK